MRPASTEILPAALAWEWWISRAGEHGGRRRTPRKRCVPPEGLDDDEQDLVRALYWLFVRLVGAAGHMGPNTVWHLRGRPARVWLRFVREPYRDARSHGQRLSPTALAVAHGLPEDSCIVSSAHLALAHKGANSAPTERSLSAMVGHWSPGAAGDVGASFAAARERCASPAPRDPAERKDWLEARTGHRALWLEAQDWRAREGTPACEADDCIKRASFGPPGACACFPPLLWCLPAWAAHDLAVTAASVSYIQLVSVGVGFRI